MLEIVLILSWILMISLTINVALLAVIYSNWVNEQLKK